MKAGTRKITVLDRIPDFILRNSAVPALKREYRLSKFGVRIFHICCRTWSTFLARYDRMDSITI